ncbi:MAG TPA: fatty acid desaturase [Thermoanaerobaculia bacterium]
MAQAWWLPVLYVLVLGHLTNICVTLYLHRSMSHQGVVFRPVVVHAMRFWLWLTTAIVTREWVAVHRKHHAFPDREGDPHSPALEGLLQVLFGGYWCYRRAMHDPELFSKYGYGTPDDWIERNLYSRYRPAGILLLLGIDILLFGWIAGPLAWLGTVTWIPLFAAGIINGLGHALGYRNFNTRDRSRNLYPIAIWMLGEELHNNHHADPRSARFRGHWWEFDLGWMYIRILAFLRLARVTYARTMAPAQFSAQHY